LFLTLTTSRFPESGHPGVEHLRIAPDQLRTARDVGVEPLRHAVVDRQHVVSDRLDQEQALQLAQFLGHLLQSILYCRIPYAARDHTAEQ
jgi:hypothetical protein